MLHDSNKPIPPDIFGNDVTNLNEFARRAADLLEVEKAKKKVQADADDLVMLRSKTQENAAELVSLKKKAEEDSEALKSAKKKAEESSDELGKAKKKAQDDASELVKLRTQVESWNADCPENNLHPSFNGALILIVNPQASHIVDVGIENHARAHAWPIEWNGRFFNSNQMLRLEKVDSANRKSAWYITCRGGAGERDTWGDCLTAADPSEKQNPNVMNRKKDPNGAGKRQHWFISFENWGYYRFFNVGLGEYLILSQAPPQAPKVASVSVGSALTGIGLRTVPADNGGNKMPPELARWAIYRWDF
ncbi:hypothetical protein BU16DRAFT_559368 [Lophium mytilinum]|uniref:Uncharacterized protein n=1 Tax=Lophium mytilinum TaxID=390894 RepID=A0A6A6R1C4_9PEZI|nr:hypothetical protein BU16DRAFT_559368 [Lophium mytilinum]